MRTTRSRSRSWRRLTAGVLALSLLTLAGCSSAVNDAAGGGDAKPQDGGILKIGVATDLLPATPFSNASDATNVLIGLVYDSLVDYPTESLEPEPALATSWSAAPDGSSLTLQLRKGVTFHSGRPFTSKDVEFSIKQWADPTFAVQFQRTAAAVTGFDTSDPHVVTLRFDHPVSNIFDLLDTLPIIDSATIDDLKAGKSYVGTGPFEFDNWTPNSQLTFSRNTSYWGGAPRLDGVQAKVVGDSQSQVSQLRSGQLDAIIGAGNRDVESLKKSGRFDVTQLTGAEQQVYVGANVANPALKNVKLRRAIAYAVDRQRIVDDVYRGAGYPINLPWPKYSPAYDEKLNSTYDRDVAKAKALVKEATRGGAAPTIPLEFDANSGNIEATAQIVQSDLADIGVKVELQPVDHNQFIKELIGAQFKGLWILNHSYAQYTPSTLAVSAYPFNADHNASHFESTRYQTDANAAWKIASGVDKRAARAYGRLNRDLLDNAFLIELAVVYNQVASSPRVHGFTWSKRQEIHLDDAYLSKG
jgi:peptide/nickel transport system substrate-binding protein